MNGKKYKVLFADDEYWTREKMKTIIKWETYQMEFMEPAQDGEDVIEIINTDCPDILITDINMPRMNGLDLLKSLKEKCPELITIVISGYDYFDYVKTALKTGAINYLMKPVTKLELINALSEALDIISKRHENIQEKKTLQAELMRASSLLQDRELSMMMNKEEPLGLSKITMNMDMDMAGYSLILIKIHNMLEIEKEYNYDINSLSYSLKQMIKDSLKIDNLIVFNHIFHSNEFILISDLENAEIAKKLGVFIIKLEKILKSSISIMVSDHLYSIDNIHSAYVQTISLLMTRPYTGKSIVILHDSISDKMQSNELINGWNEEFENRLKAWIKTNNRPMIKELVKEALSANDNNLSYFEVIQIVKKISNTIIDSAVVTKSPMDIIAIENLAELADRTVEHLDLDKLYDVLEEFIDTSLDNMTANTDGSIHEVIKQIVEYIDKNYSMELSLTNLAKQFGVESSYLSKVFRQDTGDNLMLYIAKQRIKAAQSYMAENKFTLTEIAFLVGYDDYSYFSRVFRKIVGKSPREFKEELLDE